jgi:hypothetical protein
MKAVFIVGQKDALEETLIALGQGVREPLKIGFGEAEVFLRKGVLQQTYWRRLAKRECGHGVGLIVESRVKAKNLPFVTKKISIFVFPGLVKDPNLTFYLTA